MTFTIVGRCGRTGMLGIGTSTGEMAVGSRVPFVRSHRGAVATQALTNPKLGHLGLNLLELGYDAAKVVSELTASDPYIESRQLAVIDANGQMAARTGAKNLDWKGHHIGVGCVTMGNRIVGEGVVTAMAAAFESAPELRLEERIVRALEAGRDAGGQPNGQRSASVMVCEDQVFPIVDLRVDEHPQPEAELRRLLDMYAPLIPYYRARAADPSVGAWDQWLPKQKQA